MENLTSHVAGSVVLITGGNAGIGRAAALEFAKQGAKVVVSGRREREGEEVVAGIKASGGEAIFVRADISKERDVKAMIERTLATFGRLDCAFNNAGIEQALTRAARSNRGHIRSDHGHQRQGRVAVAQARDP